MQFVMSCNSNVGMSGLSLLVDQGFSAEGVTYNDVVGFFLPKRLDFLGCCFVSSPHEHY